MPPRRRPTEEKTLDQLTKAKAGDLFELLGEARPHHSMSIRAMRDILRPLVEQQKEEGFYDPRFATILPQPHELETPRNSQEPDMAHTQDRNISGEYSTFMTVYATSMSLSLVACHLLLVACCMSLVACHPLRVACRLALFMSLLVTTIHVVFIMPYKRGH
jgi:hypothetical protein